MNSTAALSAVPAGTESERPVAALTRRLLEGPVAPTLLRLAAPNVLVMLLQATVSTLDRIFVGWLGGGHHGQSGAPRRALPAGVDRALQRGS